MTRNSLLGFVVLFVVTTFVTLVARFPLSLALLIANAPLQAERVSGTIWNGQIQNAWVSGYPVGNVSVSASALPLLMGRLAADVDVRGRLVQGGGKVSMGRRTIDLSDATFAIYLDELGVVSAFGTPIVGRVDAQVARLSLTDLKCRRADVSLVTDALARAVAPYGIDGMMLQGDGECEDDAFVLPLSGESQDGRADINIQIAPTGYMTELTLTPTNPAIGRVLVDAGFQQRGGAYSLIERGELSP